jgi:hypothetical protein
MSAAPPTSSANTGFTVAISVLSVVVVAAIIGFVVIATMPKPITECVNVQMAPQRPQNTPSRNAGGGGNMPNRNSGGGFNGGGVRQPLGSGAQNSQPSTAPVLGGAGVTGTSSAPAPAAQTQYQDGVTMQPPVMDLMHRAANAAFNVNQRSQALATTYAPAAGGGQTVQGATPPGGGDEERRLAKVPAAALNLDNSGYIPQVIAHAGGPAMAHSMPTSIMAAAFGADVPEDGTLAYVDPESAAQLDKALALSGVPASFGLDMDSYERRKAAEIIRTMELTGAADPSLEQVLAASTPFIATQGLLRRSTDAQGAIDRSIIVEPPMRFLYSNPGYRLATPGITMSPVVTEGAPITPGQEYYLLSNGCFDGQCSLSAKQEPF